MQPQQQPIVRRSMTAYEWSLLLSLSVLWGASFFFVGVAVKEVPVFTVVVARVAIAAVILLIVMRVLGQAIPRDPQILRAFVGMAVINNVMPFCLITWGQTHIPSALASILNATTPLFTVIVAHVLTSDEKLTLGRLAGVVLGLAGVAIMIGTDAVRGLGADIAGQLAILGAALCYAFGGVFARRFRRLGVSPLATATGQLTVSSLILIPVMLVVDRPWALPMPSAAAIGSLIGIATFATALAFILYFRVLATAGATNVVLVTFLVPVTAILLGLLVLGETLEPKHFLGMAVIGLGLAAIDGRLPALIARRVAVGA
jgi:drug/metabolite transporter (DMT)-like permease